MLSGLIFQNVACASFPARILPTFSINWWTQSATRARLLHLPFRWKSSNFPCHRCPPNSIRDTNPTYIVQRLPHRRLRMHFYRPIPIFVSRRVGCNNKLFDSDVSCTVYVYHTYTSITAKGCLGIRRGGDARIYGGHATVWCVERFTGVHFKTVGLWIYSFVRFV